MTQYSYPRHIKFESVLNFRDLGGYRTQRGQTVAWRRLFRSGELHYMTKRDMVRLKEEIKLRSVIDLRNSMELEQVGVGLLNEIGVKYYNIPKWKPDLITTPAVVRVNKLGDSGIDIKVLGDTKPARQWDVMGELRLRIKNVFDDEGIEIPWPHTKIYFGNNPTTISEN